MTGDVDKYFDDLGVAWRAIEIDADVVRPRVQARLRRQSLTIRTALMLGVPLAVCGIALGALTVWWGWTTATWNFVTRGIAIGVISVLAVKALVSLAAVRTSADARTLSEMLELTIRRARSTLVVIHVGLLSCAIAVVLGVIGAVIRTRAGRPPALSPVMDVAILALAAVILLVYRQRATVGLARLRYVAGVISSADRN
ncbi:MAG TPA: hypothetical protein VLV86_22535 [Vicinamibacterales bacterium]|nr:hypothetical protein [Vicinamibacterales bacterium]